MDRYEFVRQWLDGSPFIIEQYTMEDARGDLENLRIDEKVSEEALPDGLTAEFLYEEVNRYIKRYNEINS